MIVPASALTSGELRHVFNLGYSDYLMPLQLDEAAFLAHLTHHDVDLDCSAVAIEASPVAVALLARRGASAWVAGVGTAPDHRRRGLGELALSAALRRAAAQGCSVADLEVIDANRGAVALYEKLGFVIVRDLLSWALPATKCWSTPNSPAEIEETQAWIAAHGSGRDPWQRSEATAAAILAQGGTIQALMVEQDSERVAAVVWYEQPARAIVLQIAATDEATASRALLAAAGPHRALGMTNVEPESPASLALERLGARLLARQHEMRIELKDEQ